jgi:hypothetical protein
MEQVARRGPDWFYTGPLAEKIARAVASAPRNPAPMTKGDLASYDAKQREPRCGTYRRHRICGMGPPSSGATTVFAILKQLERFDLSALGPDSPDAWHLIAESMRLAYADREAYLADPDHVSVPTDGLMDAGYLAGRSALIGQGRAIASVTHGRPPGATRTAYVVHEEPAGTSHMVASDRWGNVATLTSTIEAPWGSGVTVGGMFLNNELTDFHVVPEANGGRSRTVWRREAAAKLDVADDRLRSRRRSEAGGRRGRRRNDHHAGGEVDHRGRRLGPVGAGRARAPDDDEAGQGHCGRGRIGARAAGAGADRQRTPGDGADRRASRLTQSSGWADAGSVLPIRGARGVALSQ